MARETTQSRKAVNLADLIRGATYTIESVDDDGLFPFHGDCVYVGLDTSGHYPVGSLEFTCPDGLMGIFRLEEVKALVHTPSQALDHETSLQTQLTEAKQQLLVAASEIKLLAERCDTLKANADAWARSANTADQRLKTATAEQVKIELALAGIFNPDGPGDCGDRLAAGIEKLRKIAEAEGSAKERANNQIATCKTALTQIASWSGDCIDHSDTIGELNPRELAEAALTLLNSFD